MLRGVSTTVGPISCHLCEDINPEKPPGGGGGAKGIEENRGDFGSLAKGTLHQSLLQCGKRDLQHNHNGSFLPRPNFLFAG